MCGIVGYVGPRQAATLLLEGLRRLEYRGYDSAGIAVINGTGLSVHKAAGKLSNLEKQIAGHVPMGTVGIGHTRWATHGAPTTPNAHPHTDQSGRIALIHNGIIENAGSIRKALLMRGHTFTSETDTEVLAHLVGELYQGSLEEAVAAALREVEGAYGIAVISSDEPDILVAARNGSPLIVGVGENERFVASDASPLLEHTRSVIYLDDGEMVILTRDGYRVRDLEVKHIDKPVNQIDWDLATIERGGYEHFMLKEICEQPESLAQHAARPPPRGRGHQPRGRPQHDRRGAARDRADHHHRLRHLVALRRSSASTCSRSWPASRSRWSTPPSSGTATPWSSDKTLVIGISQSGETADTLAAIREARRRGARTIGLVNVVGSTIAREVDGGIYLHAGPEIGVASTKAFTSQVAALALLTLRIGRLRNLSILQGRQFIQALTALPAQIEQILAKTDEVKLLAERFFVGQQRPLPRPGRQLPGRARGGAQAQGNLLHPRRGVSRRRK